MGKLHDLGGVGKVGLEVLLVRAVVHDGGKAGVDALKGGLVGAVIEVKGNGHGDVLGLDEVLHHVGDELKGSLPLGSTAGALDDERRLQLLTGIQNGRGPLKVVGVECTNTIVALLGALKHCGCIDEHSVTSICWKLNDVVLRQSYPM